MTKEFPKLNALVFGPPNLGLPVSESEKLNDIATGKVSKMHNVAEEKRGPPKDLQEGPLMN